MKIRCTRCSKIQDTIEAWLMHRQVCDSLRQKAAKEPKGTLTTLKREKRVGEVPQVPIPAHIA